MAINQGHHPNWSPSWIYANVDPGYCEDSVPIWGPFTIDARRMEDLRLVIIAVWESAGLEAEMVSFLSSLRQEENHCFPLIEFIADPLNPARSLVVAPYLRPFNNLGFAMFGEVMDFVTQMLEGLAFMHDQGIAHRSIVATKVMMDASPPVSPRPSSSFGTSTSISGTQFVSSEAHLPTCSTSCGPAYVFDVVRTDTAVPESPPANRCYDAYKADVYCLGNVFDKELLQRDPLSRPSASDLVRRFAWTRRRLDPGWTHWPLGVRFTPTYERYFEGDVAVPVNRHGQIIQP
ncbi:hypothetical protein C8Q77DRAFT_1076074 [Trametes polyzona]|nr:hypothetical protein C8Q77DRAFT_1076074 [Trametes polyzona]